jgi:hypothetical protein
VSVTFGIALPTIQPNNLDLATAYLMEDLRYASILAVSQNHSLRVKEVDSTHYKIHHDSNNDGVEDEGEKVVSKAIGFKNISLSFNQNALFNAEGTAEPSSITLTDSSDNRETSITISWTGRSSINENS